MVDKNGKAILIDFGASKHYDDESGENTSTLLGVNTKGYAPIEQSTQSFSSFSPATDIYALGATLYKLLTGITPPDANLLVIEEDVLQPLNSDVSAQIQYAIRKAMSLRRKDRPQTIEDFLSLLDSSKEEVPINDEATVLDVSLSFQRESDNIKRKMELAMRYYQVGDQSSYKLSIPLFTEAADYGEAEAQYYLGYCYHRGFGIEVDQQQAVKWFSKAAEQNHEWAIIMLSKCYANGIGVERDPEKAKELNLRIRKK